jgi:hypothetical protein
MEAALTEKSLYAPHRLDSLKDSVAKAEYALRTLQPGTPQHTQALQNLRHLRKEILKHKSFGDQRDNLDVGSP